MGAHKNGCDQKVSKPYHDRLTHDKPAVVYSVSNRIEIL